MDSVPSSSSPWAAAAGAPCCPFDALRRACARHAAAAARAASGFLSGEADRRDRTDVGDALGDCVGYYGGAAGALETAREDFDGGAYGDAEEEAGDAEGAADRCEQAFTDRRLDTSIVSDVDKRMKDGASVAGDLIDLLWGDKRRRHGRRLLRP